MPHSRSLAFGVIGALSVGAFLSWLTPSPAQAPPGSTPAPENNPPVTNCNLTPDTNQAFGQPPDQPTATPITAALLTSGQPCQQVVSQRDLFDETGWPISSAALISIHGSPSSR